MLNKVHMNEQFVEKPSKEENTSTKHDAENIN